MNRVLIAEDEERIASFLERGLRTNGFVTTVVANGIEAGAIAYDSDFDICILDIGLPGADGHEVLRQMRARGERMPVIILTARHGLEETVAGLEGGADDYVTKPFRFDELLARVRARLRDPVRREAETIEAAGVLLDMRARQAMKDGRAIELSAREFLLAEIFLRHPGQVLSREQILSHVWGYDFDPGSNVVDVYVGYLRKKLGAGMIETVRGMGYRLATPARRTT
jgi:DNA-binding response OmpR family regulator